MDVNLYRAYMSSIEEDLLTRGFQGVNVLNFEYVIEEGKSMSSPLDISMNVRPCIGDFDCKYIKNILDVRTFGEDLKKHVHSGMPTGRTVFLTICVDHDVKGDGRIAEETLAEWAEVRNQTMNFLKKHSLSLQQSHGTQQVVNMVNDLTSLNERMHNA